MYINVFFLLNQLYLPELNVECCRRQDCHDDSSEAYHVVVAEQLDTESR